MESPATRRGAAADGPTRITERDLGVLAFAAEHPRVRADHVQALLRTSLRAAKTRLKRLCDSGLIAADVKFEGQPRCYRIARPGLNAVQSPLPAPKGKFHDYDHDLGVAWLWLAAHQGVFGPLNRVIGERELRSRDHAARRSDPPLAIRLGGYGPKGYGRLHYPDLLLETAGARQLAVELELSTKSRGRLDDILLGYGAEPRIDAVLYLVDDRRLGERIAATARRVGVPSLVHVRQIEMPAAAKPQEAGHGPPTRQAARTAHPHLEPGARRAARGPAVER